MSKDLFLLETKKAWNYTGKSLKFDSEFWNLHVKFSSKTVLCERNMHRYQNYQKYTEIKFLELKKDYQELRLWFHNRKLYFYCPNIFDPWIRYNNVSEICVNKIPEEFQVKFCGWLAETAGKQNLQKNLGHFYLRHFHSVRLMGSAISNTVLMNANQ